LNVSSSRAWGASDWDTDDVTELTDHLSALDDNDTATAVFKLGKSPDDILRVEIVNLATITTSDTITVAFGNDHNFATLSLIPYDGAASVDTANQVTYAVSGGSPAVFTLTSGFIAALHDLGSDTWAYRLAEDGGISGDLQINELDADLTEGVAGGFGALLSNKRHQLIDGGLAA